LNAVLDSLASQTKKRAESREQRAERERESREQRAESREQREASTDGDVVFDDESVEIEQPLFEGAPGVLLAKREVHEVALCLGRGHHLLHRLQRLVPSKRCSRRRQTKNESEERTTNEERSEEDGPPQPQLPVASGWPGMALVGSQHEQYILFRSLDGIGRASMTSACMRLHRGREIQRGGRQT
jgi:hypothetical protein